MYTISDILCGLKLTIDYQKSMQKIFGGRSINLPQELSENIIIYILLLLFSGISILL